MTFHRGHSLGVANKLQLKIVAKKVLEGKTLEAEQFEFELMKLLSMEPKL